MIVVEDVHKRYLTDHGPGKWVLQGVTFTIPPKLNVGLVGCNGAGKSTLLRLIGGVDIPSRGRITRDCRVSWPMGFGGGLQGTLTGRQNAKFVCRIHGHQDDIPEKLAYIEEFAELGEAFDEPVKTYSAGMKSRLQFGLSLAFDFDVYISDEVTAAGDNAFREKAASAFKNLADHASIIMVSHGEGTLRQFCTAGIWLNEGRARWFDDINDALRAYKIDQMDKQLSELEQKRVQTENTEHIEIAIEKLLQQRTAMDALEKGMRGAPVSVSHEEGLLVMQEARQQGMQLFTQGQITQSGYKIKPESKPIVKKYFAAPHNKHLELFDLNSQCEKVENTK